MSPLGCFFPLYQQWRWVSAGKRVPGTDGAYHSARGASLWHCRSPLSFTLVSRFRGLLPQQALRLDFRAFAAVQREGRGRFVVPKRGPGAEQ